MFLLMRVLVLLFVGAALPFPAYSAEPIKIGVLAFRPKPQTLEQWQPLAAALKRALPNRDFVVEAYTFPEMEQVVADRKIDFVLTNPGHYVLLTKRIGLSAPLATLSVDQRGEPASVFGGVIITRAGRTGIDTLHDIRGKTVAATSTDSFGGYQMQAYELSRVGIRLPQNARLITTGMPHDKVVEALLRGHADVGFVRTGVLEGMAREGKLDMSQIKILNPQQPPGFKLHLSTRLYPEWAFAVLPHVDASLARHVAAALYVLEDNTAAVRAMNIHGFIVPPDYTPVADLLKELRLPPFDEAPSFTLQDVWARYFWQMLGALIALSLIILLGVRLLIARRKLQAQHRLVLSQKQQLQRTVDALNESHQKMYSLLNSMAEGAYGVDTQGNCTFVNRSFLRILGYSSPDEVIGKHMHDLIHYAYPDGSPYPEGQCQMYGVLQTHREINCSNEVFWRKDGSSVPVEYWVQPIVTDGEVLGAVATFVDITERKLMEDQVRHLAFYDTLTNLPNRRLLNDRLSQAMTASKRSGLYGALMFLDLDNFKPLNDRHGHEVGDLLLIEAAARLKACVRAMDTVARFGGDEFVVILSELNPVAEASRTQAGAVAEKIHKALSAPYRLTVRHEGQADVEVEHHCTASIGVALFLGNDTAPDDVLKWADIAMYQAKEGGRNRVRFYTI